MKQTITMRRLGTGITLATMLVLLAVVMQLPGQAAAVLTASKTAALLDSVDGEADSGETIRYTVTIENAGDNTAENLDFDDMLDPNTRLVTGSIETSPLAYADIYDVPNGTLTVDAAAGVLANDIDPDGDGLPRVVAFDATTVEGGTVAVNGDGSFVYTPPDGYAGLDAFTYTVEDIDGWRDTAEVILSVGTVIWFIDDDAAPGGDGSLARPYDTVAAFNAGASDAPGDIIFVFGGTYSGEGFTLLDGQQLVGEGAGLTLNANIPAGPTPVLGTTGGDPLVTLGRDNTLAGFDIGDTPGAYGISGTNVGTLTILDVGIIDSGGGMFLDGGALNVSLERITVIDSPGPILDVRNVTGNLTVVADLRGAGVALRNSPAATFRLDALDLETTDGSPALLVENVGTLTTRSGVLLGRGGPAMSLDAIGTGDMTLVRASSLDSGTHGVSINDYNGAMTLTGGITVMNPGADAISLTNSAATFNVAAFNASDVNGYRAVYIAGVSQVNAGSGDVATTDGAAFVAVNSGLNVRLSNVTSTGARDGFIFNNTSGNFSIAQGTVNCASGRGATLRNTSNITFENTSFTGCSAGIRVELVTGLTLNNVTIADTSGAGILADSLVGSMALTDLTIMGGKFSNTGLPALSFSRSNTRNLLGTVVISGTDFDQMSASAFNVINNAGSATIQIDDVDFTGPCLDCYAINAFSTNDAEIALTVTNSRFSGVGGVNAEMQNANGQTMTTIVTGSTLTDGPLGQAALRMTAGGNGTHLFTLQNNTVTDWHTNMVVLLAHGIGGGMLSGVVDNNSLTGDGLFAQRGIDVETINGGTGIPIMAQVKITANVIDGVTLHGIRGEADSRSGSASGLDITIENNDVRAPSMGAGTVFLRGEQQAGVCLDISGNTIIGNSTSGESLFVEQRDAVVFALEGLTNTPANGAAAANFLTQNNLLSNPDTALAVATTGFTNANCGSDALVALPVATTTTARPAMVRPVMVAMPTTANFTAPASVFTGASTITPTLRPDVTVIQREDRVGLELSDFPPGKVLVIQFDVRVNDDVPPQIAQICNQGTVNAARTTPITTGDPVCIAVDQTPPAMMVDIAPDLDEVTAPGEDVTFTVEVMNTGDGALTLNELSDSMYGDLARIPGSTCALPAPIAEGNTYTCAFTAEVAGAAGTTQTNTVTARAVDAEDFPVMAEDFAEVNIVAPPVGTIIVELEATPADDTLFPFTGDLGSFVLRDPTQNSATFGDQAPGAYNIVALPLPDWTLTDITCTDPGVTSPNSVTVNLEAGEIITCTFTVAQETGEITIIKQATPADNTPFPFTGDLGEFTLRDPDSDRIFFGDLPAGSYTVREDIPAGWDFLGVECETTDTGDSPAVVNAGVTIDLDPGEQVTCTFINFIEPEPETGTLAAFKFYDANWDGLFNGGDNPLAGWKITLADSGGIIAEQETGDDGFAVFSNLDAGPYEVCEVQEPGWVNTTPLCQQVTVIADQRVEVAFGNRPEAPPNNAPIARDDTVTTERDTPVTINVLANDSDADGDFLIVSTVSGPANGGIVLNADGSYTYTPNAGYIGDDSFVYQISDGGAMDTATVFITVVEPAPVCTDPNPTRDLSGSLLPESGFSAGRITNTSEACTYEVGIASYRKFDDIIDNQALFDYTVVEIAPGASIQISVGLPDCAAQVDLFWGPVLLSLDGQRYGARLLDFAHIGGDNFCALP